MHSDEAMTTAHSRARMFLEMNREGQLKFIAERLSEADTMELANVIRAIFGHPDDKGRPRKTTPRYQRPADKPDRK